MAEQNKELAGWLEELKKKSKNGVISNKDIMDLIEEKNLSEEDLSDLYEGLHEEHYEVNFDMDVSDDDLDYVEDEEDTEEKEEADGQKEQQ